MKKILPVLAILGSAAAVIAYKMKKEEQKQIIDLDQGLLFDDDDSMNNEEDSVEEAPISHPYPVNDEEIDRAFEEAHESLEGLLHDKEEAKDDTQDDHDEMFHYLTHSEMLLLKEDSDQRVAALEEKGDVHDHERPIQHHIQFDDEEGMTAFKNEVINRGYVITNGSEDLELIVLHITPMDMVKLMSNVYYLADVAAKYDGVYKGWQSKVVY